MGCGASKAPPPAATPASNKPANPAKLKRQSTVHAADEAKYGQILTGHEDAVDRLFAKMDVDEDEVLTKDELKEVVALYNGAAFDADKFFGWYDTHGSEASSGPDGTINQTEFGFYLADVACSFPNPVEAMSGVIKEFDEKVDENMRS